MTTDNLKRCSRDPKKRATPPATQEGRNPCSPYHRVKFLPEPNMVMSLTLSRGARPSAPEPPNFKSQKEHCHTLVKIPSLAAANTQCL